MVARYVTLEPSYGPMAPGGMHVQIPAGTEIEHEGDPGYHMQPINADAQTAVDDMVRRRKRPHQMIDPIKAVIENGQRQSRLEALREQEGNNVMVDMAKALHRNEVALTEMAASLKTMTPGQVGLAETTTEADDDETGGSADEPGSLGADGAGGKRGRGKAIPVSDTGGRDQKPVGPKSNTGEGA